MGATATATIDPVTGAVTAINLVTVGSGYTLPPIVTIAAPPAGGTPGHGNGHDLHRHRPKWAWSPRSRARRTSRRHGPSRRSAQPGDILDNRTGGVPDPRNIGPSMVQIGTEGGFLPTPVVLPNTPIGYERNPKNIVVTNVSQHNLLLGPAERADVIIDFSQFAGKTIILYNDCPAAIPAADSRLDYYTDDVDQTATGGTVSTLPGYGPNTRTIMEFHVSATGVPHALRPGGAAGRVHHDHGSRHRRRHHAGVFVRDQDPIIVPQAPYDSAYGTTTSPPTPRPMRRIQNTSLTFKPLDLTTPAPADQVADPGDR